MTTSELKRLGKDEMDAKSTDALKVKQAQWTPPYAPRARKRPTGLLIGIILLIALVAAGYFIWVRLRALHQQTAEQASRAGGAREIPVVAVAAKQGDLPIYLNGLGTITPFNLVTVRPRVTGQIVNVAFKEGQDVKKDDLLIEIDPRPFEVELQQAEGQLGKDQALLNNAKKDLERYQSAGLSVAQQQIDLATSQVRQFEAAIKSDQAGINNARLNLAYCKVTAPISGRIGLRKVDVGNMVMANDASGLATITQLQPIALVFNISQDDAVPVVQKEDGGIGLTVDAYDRGFENQLAVGQVSAVDNQIDPSTGTLKIKARFENKNNALFPNQFVNARLLVETLQAKTIVPAAAIQHGPDGEFVYVVRQDQTVEVRPVKLGPSTDDRTVIDDGLKPGETVVTDGVDKLQPGAKVAVREGGRRGATSRPSTQKGLSLSPVLRGEGGGEGREALVLQSALFANRTHPAPLPNPLPGVPGRGSKMIALQS